MGYFLLEKINPQLFDLISKFNRNVFKVIQDEQKQARDISNGSTRDDTKILKAKSPRSTETSSYSKPTDASKDIKGSVPSYSSYISFDTTGGETQSSKQSLKDIKRLKKYKINTNCLILC